MWGDRIVILSAPVPLETPNSYQHGSHDAQTLRKITLDPSGTLSHMIGRCLTYLNIGQAWPDFVRLLALPGLTALAYLSKVCKITPPLPHHSHFQTKYITPRGQAHVPLPHFRNAPK